MTSIIAVVQTTALLTAAILTWICLVCSYQTSARKSGSQAPANSLTPDAAKPLQQLSRRKPRRRRHWEPNFLHPRNVQGAYE